MHLCENFLDEFLCAEIQLKWTSSRRNTVRGAWCNTGGAQHTPSILQGGGGLPDTACPRRSYLQDTQYVLIYISTNQQQLRNRNILNKYKEAGTNLNIAPSQHCCAWVLWRPKQQGLSKGYKPNTDRLNSLSYSFTKFIDQRNYCADDSWHYCTKFSTFSHHTTFFCLRFT